jgi:hypothetical protein
MRNGILGEEESVASAHMVSDPTHIIPPPTPAAEQFRGVNESVIQRAKKLCYVKQTIRVVGTASGAMSLRCAVHPRVRLERPARSENDRSVSDQ